MSSFLERAASDLDKTCFIFASLQQQAKRDSSPLLPATAKFQGAEKSIYYLSV